MRLSPEQFEKLAVEQMDTLYRVALRLSRRHEQAEDLVQETYLRAIRARESFDLQFYGIRPWLLRIMHNLWMNMAGHESRQPRSMDDEHLSLAGGASADVLPIDPASYEGMDERLVRALDSLQPEYSTVLTLWAVADLSYREVAQAMNIPVGTVMSRLHRARQKLSEQLKGLAKEERIIRE